MKEATGRTRKLLEPLSWRIVSSADSFDPAEKFIEKADIDYVSLVRLNEVFKDNFYKKEVEIKEGNIQICQLASGIEANDAAIIYDLLAKRSQTFDLEFDVTLCYIWELLKNQPDGRDGKLTTADGEKNIFFSKNSKRILMPVEVYWKEEDDEKKRLTKSGWVIVSYPDSSLKRIKIQEFSHVYNRMRKKNDQIFWLQTAA